MTCPGEARVLPLACSVMCRPKTQPSAMMASHGTIGYLMEASPSPDVAKARAAGTDAEPGGDHIRLVSDSPSRNQPRPKTSSPQVGNRRRIVMPIMETPMAVSTLKDT